MIVVLLFRLLCALECNTGTNDEGESFLKRFNIFDPLHAHGLVMVQMDFEHELNKSPPPSAV